MSGTSEAIQTASATKAPGPMKFSEVPKYDKLQWMMERGMHSHLGSGAQLADACICWNSARRLQTGACEYLEAA